MASSYSWQGSSHLYVGQELIIPSPAQPACMTLSQGPPLRYLLRKENLETIPALKPIVQNKIVESMLPKWEPEPFGLPCHGGWLSSFYGWKGRYTLSHRVDDSISCELLPSSFHFIRSKCPLLHRIALSNTHKLSL